MLDFVKYTLFFSAYQMNASRTGEMAQKIGMNTWYMGAPGEMPYTA